MSGVRFKNLVSLIRNMEESGWIIDSFPFSYNKIDTFVILRIFQKEESIPNEFAKAEVEFIKTCDTNISIKGYLDFFEVYFTDGVNQFINFFNITGRNANRELFLDFSKYFASFIPTEKIEFKDNPIERRLLASRCERNNPKAIYCYDVRRNGVRQDGTNNTRSIENSNKAQILRPELYQRFFMDSNLSFFFSENQEDELTDKDIIERFANRK